MADIKKLIAQLKREVPEVAGNPILDEIEGASLGDEEAAESDEDAALADLEADDADAEFEVMEDEAPAEDDEELPAPKGKPGKKLPKMPFM